MAAFFLDTNHASPLVTLHHPMRARFFRARRTGDSFAVSAPVIAETVCGLGVIRRAEENLEEWERLLPLFEVCLLDEIDGRFAAELQLQLRRSGRQLDTVDALTAAVALRYGLTLLTTDGDFSAVPQLSQENWLA